MVAEGQPAPDFTLTSDAGEKVSLSDFRGKPVVVYFYPKDDTLSTFAQYAQAVARRWRRAARSVGSPEPSVPT